MNDKVKTVKEGSGFNHGNPEWFEALNYFVSNTLQREAGERVALHAGRLIENLRAGGLGVPALASTPYVNTIPGEQQPEYPGDREI